MLYKMKTLLVASALSAMASVGAAASLDLDTTTPVLTVSNASVDFFDFGFTASPVFDGFTGITTNGVTDLFFDAELESTDPYAADFGSLDVSDETGLVILGDLVDFGFTSTSLEFLFDVIDGRLATDFGAQALLEFTLDAGTSLVLSDLQDGDVIDGSLTVSAVGVAPVPLPAGLPLLASTFGAFYVIRRRRRSA